MISPLSARYSDSSDRCADAEVKFAPLRTIDVLVSDVSVVRAARKTTKANEMWAQK